MFNCRFNSKVGPDQIPITPDPNQGMVAQEDHRPRFYTEVARPTASIHRILNLAQKGELASQEVWVV